ncbi:hypothetical protein [Kiloniella antarctica]|uniref:Citrate lyase ligase C-terminal domain-containing protein n=1 Tax=Kiloniella antarctica TaxID=1550907 RepID=A0ABW5BSP2_9PROT
MLNTSNSSKRITSPSDLKNKSNSSLILPQLLADIIFTAKFNLSMYYHKIELAFQRKYSNNIKPFQYLSLERYGSTPNENGTHSYGSRIAIPILEQLIAENDQDKQAHLDLAHIYLSINQKSRALDVYKKMHTTFPNDPNSLIAQLNILLELGHIKEANSLAKSNITSFDCSILNSESYSAWIKSLMKAPNFNKLNSKDFGDLFFIPYMVKELKSELSIFNTILVDHCYASMISLAQAYVEKKGGYFLFATVDRIVNVRNRSISEDQIVKAEELVALGKIDRKEWLSSVPPHIKKSHKELSHFSAQYWKEILFGPSNILKGTKLLVSEYTSQYVNVKSGRRVTKGHSINYENNIFLFGTSDIYGTGCEDQYTIANYMQNIIQKTDLGEKFRVENHGVRGALLPNVVLNLFTQTIRPNDIVIFYGFPKLDSNEISNLPQTHLELSRPHSYGEIFNDESHLNWKGNKVAANHITQYLVDNKWDVKKPKIKKHSKEIKVYEDAEPFLNLMKYLLHRNSTVTTECGGIDAYCSYIKENEFIGTGTRGSVSVNCNPITLGHLHLLEYAANQVDYLYVFVIEEDLSYFKFQDRLRLVIDSVKHLKNVKVLRGGRYICTHLTFPEYYTKEEDVGALADASEEAWYFCEHIAPVLNITSIFLGSEPTCKITQQYNQQMSTLLKMYDIDVDIISRINFKNKAISASEVRKLLKDLKFDEIKKLVPPSTYAFLKQKYSNDVKRDNPIL